ncbi:MAG: hypothetical protein N3G20_00965, partial [Verrucomicrobiae bacterium]|nr:hypothetical protein [Verrucomicrobiae bacterium]
MALARTMQRLLQVIGIANRTTSGGVGLMSQISRRGSCGLVAGTAIAVLLHGWVRADLQFDVFVGYGSSGGSDGIVREGCWFPVACEVFNDGEAFDALFEFSSVQTGGAQVRRMHVELPTNTRKRFSFPVFAGSSRYATWRARLVDKSGKLRAERPDIQVQDIARGSFLLGGLARSFAGLPVLPQPGSNRGPQAKVARMTVEQFPDNPIALEGLSAIYINSEKAIELKPEQVFALRTWLHAGGVAVVGIEQMQDVTSTRWLRELLGIELTGGFTNQSLGELHNWLLSPEAPYTIPHSTIQRDDAFEATEFLAYASEHTGHKVRLAVKGKPLLLTKQCGRGELMTLLFSPEREPFKSWKCRDWFWAKLLRIKSDYFQPARTVPYGGVGIDGVFGAMIETRQTRKLAVEWLLVLLVVYLVVIGPMDYYVLKRINRQMLTWLTFPAYVVFFSLLIYWIGYKLRAGESEWNELHLTDVLPIDGGAILRGRTYGSLYSSSNARYKLGADLPSAALRGEYRGAVGGGQETAHIDAELVANSFRAEVSVPVWSSLMYVAEWAKPGELPISAQVISSNSTIIAHIENRLSRTVGPVLIAYRDRLYRFESLAPGQRTTVKLDHATAAYLESFVRSHGAHFQQAAMARNLAFGSTQQSKIDPTPENIGAASFVTLLTAPRTSQQKTAGPPGLSAERGFVSLP